MKSANELVKDAIAALDMPGRPTKEVQFPPQHPSQLSSPKDGSFVEMLDDDGRVVGCLPPTGIFVEFATRDEFDVPIKGMTARLGEMGPLLKGGQVVYVTVEPHGKRVYFAEDVCKWREIIKYDELTPALLEYTKTVIPHAWHGPINAGDDQMMVDWSQHSWAVRRAFVYTVLKEAGIDTSPAAHESVELLG